MIISNRAAVQRIARIYQEQRRAGLDRKKSASLSFNDEVELSSESKEIQAMLRRLKTAPSIRVQAEKIKVALNSGDYKVSPEQIAQKLLESWGKD